MEMDLFLIVSTILFHLLLFLSIPSFGCETYNVATLTVQLSTHLIATAEAFLSFQPSLISSSCVLLTFSNDNLCLFPSLVVPLYYYQRIAQIVKSLEPL